MNEQLYRYSRRIMNFLGSLQILFLTMGGGGWPWESKTLLENEAKILVNDINFFAHLLCQQFLEL